MVIPRAFSSGALSISSYLTGLLTELGKRLARTCVSAAVKVVLPWSTCPIVPTFTCGFVRSNFPFDTAYLQMIDTVDVTLRSFLHDGVGDIGRHFHVLRELHRVIRPALAH